MSATDGPWLSEEISSEAESGFRNCCIDDLQFDDNLGLSLIASIFGGYIPARKKFD